jgi:hypothetical protein
MLTPTKPRLNMIDAVRDLAPSPPPCFLNRSHWRQYLESAAKAQNQRREPKVIIMTASQPAFNRDFPFCADCTQAKKMDMAQKDKCQPNWLRENK